MLARHEFSMQKYKILNGLPAYGPLPEQFSSTGMGKHSEGFVVEFYPRYSQKWIGNFQPGLGGVNDVIEHLDGEHVIVIAAGQAYVIEPETRLLVKDFGGQIEHVMQIADLDIMVFGNGLWFEALGPNGFLWQTRRLSWDGMRSILLEEMTLSGEGYDPMTDSWVPFAVDLNSGNAEGGSYNGP